MRELLKAQILATGPMRVADYMAACLYHPEHGYYARAPKIGADGDFITAPSISQMFGELIGLWSVHEWDVLGRPDPFHLIELGPGTGALMSDAWRAARIVPDFQRAARIQLIEVSATLRDQQAKALMRVGARCWFQDRLEDIPTGPSLIIANEFFDCLPIRQFIRIESQWRERLIGVDEQGELQFGLSGYAAPAGDSMIPPRLFDAADGAIAEHAPNLSAQVDAIAARLNAAPGRALIIDYASDGDGDTLQALRNHQKENPLSNPGEADLTAHVDFTALKILARASGLAVAGATTQAELLSALGISARAEALANAHPERGERIQREFDRLTRSDQMGTLFKALCLSSPSLPPPAGF